MGDRGVAKLSDATLELLHSSRKAGLQLPIQARRPNYFLIRRVSSAPKL